MSKNKYKNIETQKSKENIEIDKKNPSDIVGGFDPSLSFKDILSSYERTGNPYSLKKAPKEEKESKESFGDILLKWDKMNNKSVNKTSESSSSSKIISSNKSFDEILSEWEGENKKGGQSTNLNKNEKRSINEILDIVSDENLETSDMFLKEDEENKASKGVSWSVYGGKKEVARPQKEEMSNEEEIIKKEVKINSKVVSSNEDFGTTLSKWGKINNVANVLEKDEDIATSVSAKSDRNNESTGKTFSHFDSKYSSTTFEEICKEKGDDENKVKEPTLNELRRMNPQSTLDLHGYTSLESEKMVKDFIIEAKESSLKKIAIITGKGLHSDGGNEVIRSTTENILKESTHIREYSYAPINKGGNGVFWILLK